MTTEDALDEGEVHDVLRNERRRLTLEELRDNGGSLSVRELSEQVAALETGESPPPRNIRQSVYVSLHQTHLPKLDDLGIVEYDADAKRVTLTDRVREVEAYMRLTIGGESGSEPEPELEPGWTRYYLGLSVVGLCAMAAVALGVPVLGAIGAPAVGSVLFVALFVLAVGQSRSGREHGSDREDSDRPEH